MADASAFGARLLQLREAAGMSQKQLAAATGASQKAVSFWERGEREPAWSAVVKLAEALGVDIRAFLRPTAPKATAEPAPKRGRGRPPGPVVEEPAAKRPRGRPRKAT